MNNLVLMSIQTKYANEIFSGRKKYEYRKSSIGENNLNKKIYIYSAKVDKKIIGYIIIDKVLKGTIDEIIEKTNPKEANIREYFSNAKLAYALHIKSFHKFESPIGLKELKKIDKNIMLPQYYKYIKENNKIYTLLKERT